MKKSLLFLTAAAMFAGSLFANTPVTSTRAKTAQALPLRPSDNLEEKSTNFAIPKSQNAVTKKTSKQPKLRYTARKTGKPDTATVILRVDGYPLTDGDGSHPGFQMLLDKDATIDANFELFYRIAVTALYDESEYKIPDGASSNMDDIRVILDSEGVLDIPAGIYDLGFMVASAFYDDVFIAWWPFGNTYRPAHFNDFEFKAGYEYVFFFNEENVDVLLYEVDDDIEMVSVTLPEPSATLTNAEDITVTIKNAGVNDISSVNLSYKINNEAPVEETWTGTLAPEAETTYTFTAKADFSAGGMYKVEASADFAEDLNPMNKTQVAYTKKAVPMTLPFVEKFDDELNLLSHWNAQIDANEDEATWTYDGNNTDADDGAGFMNINCVWWGDNPAPADDYMITDAITLAAGDHHVAFYGHFGGTEQFKILYGTSPDTAQMSVLADFTELEGAFWQMNNHNFEITTPGDYYFAFHYYSDPAAGRSMRLDNIEIATGDYVGIPDIVINSVSVPTSACGLSTATLSAEVFNNGTEPITEFTLSYQFGDEDPVSELFTETIDLYETKTVTFKQSADFSTPGEYEVVFEASTDNEEETDNNEKTASFTHFAPITELPFNSNFANEEDQNDWVPSGRWNMSPVQPCYTAPENTTTPLLSRCVTLPVGEYRFSYTYLAGFTALSWADDFYVAYGKVGTDPATWAHAKEYVDEDTKAQVVEDDISVNITEAGEYVFAFIPVAVSNLGVYTTSIAVMPEHDSRINKVTSPLYFSNTIPENHTSGLKTFTVSIENRGKTATEKGNIALLLDNAVTASTSFSFTSLGEVKNVDVTGNFQKLAIGERELKFRISTNGTVNDSLVITKMVSDSTFAWDGGQNFDMGFRDGQGGVGMIYELGQADVLTSISVGFAATEYTGNIGLAVYPVDNDLKLGTALLEENFPRTNGNNDEYTNFDVSNTVLPAGKYYFEVRQLTTSYMGIMTDRSEDGYLYQSGNSLQAVSGNGYLCLRPNVDYSLIASVSPDAMQQKLSLYPNPVEDVLNIETDQTITEIAVIDQNGRIVKTQKGNQKTLNMQALPAGNYVVRVHTSEGVVAMKVVKK